MTLAAIRGEFCAHLAAHRNRHGGGLTRCLSEGIAAGIQLRSLAGTQNGWMELNCEGPTAEALFAAMELVSEQKLSGPPFVDQITRHTGNISGFLVDKRHTSCGIQIDASFDFPRTDDALNDCMNAKGKARDFMLARNSLDKSRVAGTITHLPSRPALRFGR